MAQICCEPQVYIYRINPDTGRMERSVPDSNVWTADPNDPIHAPVMLPPITRPTVDHTKCDAATNFSEHFNDVITATSENLGTASSVAELAAAIAGVLLDIFIIIVTGGAGAVWATSIATAIFGVVTAAFTEGKAAFDAYWTNDNKDKVLCAALCTIGENGQFSQTQWEDCKHQIKLDLTPSPALDMVLTAVNAAGYVGANQMASYGAAADADCGGCDCLTWCYTWDLTMDKYLWDVVDAGVYVVGEGFKVTNAGTSSPYFYRFSEVKGNFGETIHLTEAHFYTHNTDTSSQYPSEDTKNRIWHDTDTSPNYLANTQLIGDGNLDVSWSGTLADDNIGATLVSNVTTGDYGTGEATLYRITLMGTGINPFGDDNCP